MRSTRRASYSPAAPHPEGKEVSSASRSGPAKFGQIILGLRTCLVDFVTVLEHAEATPEQPVVITATLAPPTATRWRPSIMFAAVVLLLTHLAWQVCRKKVKGEPP